MSSNNLTPQKRVSTPSKGAYAGPTFHASPAPSSLPMPRFFSKSAQDADGLRTTKEESSDEGGPHSPSPQPANLAAIKNESTRKSSPLDMFFDADRAEKARAASASARTPDRHSRQPSTHAARSPANQGNSAQGHTGLLQDGLQYGPHRTPKETFVPERARALMFDDARPQSHGVINTGRQAATRMQTAPSNLGSYQATDGEADRAAKSQALKDLLWSSNGSRATSSTGSFPPPPHASNGSVPSTPFAPMRGMQIQGSATRSPSHQSHSPHAASMGGDHTILPIHECLERLALATRYSANPSLIRLPVMTTVGEAMQAISAQLTEPAFPVGFGRLADPTSRLRDMSLSGDVPR